MPSHFFDIQILFNIFGAMEQMDEQRRNRKRMRTRASSNNCGGGRAIRIAKRNRVLVARWYYWTECRRLRADDAINRLCDEFFIEARTVTNAILDGDGYFRELMEQRATCKALSIEYESFNWR